MVQYTVHPLTKLLHFCLLGFLLFFAVFFRVVCWDLCPSACYFFRPALVVLVWGVFWFVCVPCWCSVFFSSSMADVALWLGPYMSISSKNAICTRTEKARKCRQITTNQPSHRPARRPANSPARLAFRQKKQHAKRGKSPNKNTHKRICHRTQWSDHCITLSSCWCSVVLRVCVGLWRVLFSFLCSFARFCSCWLGCFGLARSLLAASTPCPPHSLGWSSGAFWSSQCSAGPSLRVSGCICNGPVVIPVDGLAPVFTSPHGNKGFGVLPHVAGVVQVLVSEDCSGFHG